MLHSSRNFSWALRKGDAISRSVRPCDTPHKFRGRTHILLTIKPQATFKMTTKLSKSPWHTVDKRGTVGSRSPLLHLWETSLKTIYWSTLRMLFSALYSPLQRCSCLIWSGNKICSVYWVLRSTCGQKMPDWRKFCKDYCLILKSSVAEVVPLSTAVKKPCYFRYKLVHCYCT